MSEHPILYRKRLIPDECILLKDDILIERTDEYILTKWHTLHPKKRLDHGMSCYLPKMGWKISLFLTADNRLLYYYCDIISTDYNSDTDTYVFTDLLVDVIIYPDGDVHVVDLDETAEALDKKLISTELLSACMRSVNELLNLSYSGQIFELKPVARLIKMWKEK